MRTNKGYFFSTCYSKGISHCCLSSADSKAGREWENGEGFGYALVGGCGRGVAEGGLTNAGIVCHWLGEHIWLSLLGSALEVRDKN